jgi:hypothetical protein
MAAFHFRHFRCLAGNGIYRAGINARTTIGAGVCVDYKLVVALADGLHRAGGFACAARNTFARNYVCHDQSPWFVGLFFSHKFDGIYQQKS